MMQEPAARPRGGVAVDMFPPWVAWLQAALMAVLVMVVALHSTIPHRAHAVALLVVATAGWWLAVIGVRLAPGLHATLALGGTAALNLGAERFGFLGETSAVQVTLMITVFLAGEAVAHFPVRTMVLTVGGATLVASAPLGWPGEQGAEIWIVAVILAALVGVFLRTLLRALADLEAAQAELATTAATEERRRLAREVHDVIAHSLTVTMLHLTAARLAVGRDDPGAATEALEEAERAGRQSLADVRRTVGLLRAEDHGDAIAAPSPLAADVADLIEGFRAAGLVIDSTVTGDLQAMGAPLGLVLYRIVQESLANAARHTPGATATIEIAVGAPTLVRVRSRGGRPARATAGAGCGLVGMRERAEATGGWCRAGPEDDGGWLVEAELPGDTVGTRVSR